MVNPGYALGQLARAMATATSHGEADVRERATRRAEAWTQAVEGMAAGSIRVGSRTPVAAPAWATLEVLHGGFASGNLLAGGPPRAHEIALAARLGVEPGDRLAMNLHHCSDAGREELRRLLDAGTYRVEVPEEAALLAVVALLDAGRPQAAAGVVDAIAGWMDRLRFYPVPAATPMLAGTLVHRDPVGKVRGRLEDLDTPRAVLDMNETLSIWRPFTDRAVALLLTTVEGEPPFVVVDAAGAGRRGAKGELLIGGGWPGRVVPDGFRLEALALLAEYASLRQRHGSCQRVHGRRSNLWRLTGRLQQLAATCQPLEPRETGMLRVVLATHVFRHGAPGSARLAERRAAEARHAARPTRAQWGKLLAARLVELPDDEGLASLEPYAIPVGDAESDAHRMAAGAEPPRWMTRRLERALDASIEELIERGLIPSGEVLAQVLPQVTSHVRAMAIEDRRVALLRAAVDAAFTRRRSLLLLHYARQVGIAELPWVAALDTLRSSSSTATTPSRRALDSVALLSLEAFPHAILPNPLINELRSLAKEARVEIPFVEELAADIFQGGFTAKFVEAAAVSAEMLEGTLYQRYFDVPFAEMRALAASIAASEKPAARRSPRPKPHVIDPMGAICRRMAGVASKHAGAVAQNGAVIEQQQILTTQNLAPLIHQLGLRADVEAIASRLADQCFDWIVAELSRTPPTWIDGLRSTKNAAYAWRQMLVYLAIAPRGSADEFERRGRAKLAEARPSVEKRLTPFLDGVACAARGDVTPREQRFIGWVTG